MDNDDALIGKEIGRCRIQRKLGQGGMGAVYLAHHPGLNRSVAIKLLTSELASNPEFRERFVREARLAARLEHPNVVQVHDVGEEAGVHFISMQYVEGKSLDAILKEKKKLTLNESLSITKRVAVALAAAAKLGIVHRDIKPHNILISKDGVVKVADFGLAKDQDSNRSISEPGVIMGTPYYMAPEQAKGEVVDHRGDIYSLGATLYHMLSGRRLFDGGTPVSIVLKQISDQPVPIRELEPTIPDAVEALLAKMLQKDPANRFASAEELIRALDGVKQPGPSTVKVSPSNRKAAMIALPIAGILTVGIVLGLILGRGTETVKDPPPAPLVGKLEPKVVVEKPAEPPPVPAPPPPPPEPAAKPPEPDPAPKPEPAPKPFERVLSRMKEGMERRYSEEAMSRTEEFLQAIQKKDTKAIRSMVDEVALGQMSDAEVLTLLTKNNLDKATLESWDFQDVDVKLKLPGARPQPHAMMTMTFDLKVPKGELKMTDQVLHLIRKLDGKWYITRPPRAPK